MDYDLVHYIVQIHLSAVVGEEKFLRVSKLSNECLRAMVKPLHMCYLILHDDIHDFPKPG